MKETRTSWLKLIFSIVLLQSEAYVLHDPTLGKFRIRAETLIAPGQVHVPYDTVYRWPQLQLSQDSRFQVKASNKTSIDDERIITINDAQYNLTPWANAHPGGVQVLRRFHGKDATAGFFAAGHSDGAMKLLQHFQVHNLDKEVRAMNLPSDPPNHISTRWRTKLISNEDPNWIHKTLGIYALFHFAIRISIALFGNDPAAGLGSNFGKGASILGITSLLPHLLLSYSSLIFKTVPRERVVGKPMIWKENRWHSILFVTRSILCSSFAWMSVRFDHREPWRTISLTSTCLCVLLIMIEADMVTKALKPAQKDSSIANLPFWEECELKTTSVAKHFYAYSQFVATSTCLLVANPIWPFALSFPIQFASFLLTLSRKGLISAKGWHIGYIGSLLVPLILAPCAMIRLRSVTFISGLLLFSFFMFRLRCLGINKYILWVPVLGARLLVGDKYIPFDMW